jgi:hypothetical protein
VSSRSGINGNRQVVKIPIALTDRLRLLSGGISSRSEKRGPACQPFAFGRASKRLRPIQLMMRLAHDMKILPRRPRAKARF